MAKVSPREANQMRWGSQAIYLLALIALSVGSIPSNARAEARDDWQQIRRHGFGELRTRLKPVPQTGPATIAFADTSLGSDAQWSREFPPLGASGSGQTVRAVLVHDRELVAAGDFGFMDGVAAPHVAAWDGTQWNALGDELPFQDGVNCLAVHGGRMIAGGIAWPPYSTTCIAQWDGDAWRPLGGGLQGGYSAVIGALEVFAGDLVAAGRFSRAGEEDVHSIARWDGKTWSRIGDDSVFAGGAGVALTVHNGELYAGFNFLENDTLIARVARLDGESWTFLGEPMDAHVTALASFHGLLIASGLFSRIGTMQAQSIASWDGGSWSPLGEGLSKETGRAFVRDVFAFGDRLIAGGDFDRAGAITAFGIASWNGSEWDSVGTRIGPRPGCANVVSITEFGGRLMVAGYLIGPGGFSLGGLAVLNGSRWGPIAARGIQVEFPDCFLSTDSGLIAAGSFSVAGERAVDGVARWDGTRWKMLGTMTSGGVAGALAIYHDKLVVAGSFGSMDSVPTRNIAQWDGASWTPLGEGTDRFIADLIVFGDRLIAAGIFQHAGGQRVNCIAQWDGGSWGALGAGVWGLPPVVTIEPHIRDLEVYDDNLIACGHFTKADYVDVPGVARWDGKAWSSLDAEIAFEDEDGPWVFDLTLWNGTLVVSGWFRSVNGQHAENFVLWDGVSWRPLSFLHGIVTELGVYNGRLVVGGNFNNDFDWESSCIFQWDGDRWYRMGKGVWSGTEGLRMYPGVTALATWQGSLYVGGHFNVAGDKPAHRVARWEGQGFRLPVPTFSFAVAPNPARDELVASFYLADPGIVRAVLFDVLGRRAAEAAQGRLPGGQRQLRWRLQSNDGQRLPAGIYFLQLETERASATRKVTIIH